MAKAKQPEAEPIPTDVVANTPADITAVDMEEAALADPALADIFAKAEKADEDRKARQAEPEEEATEEAAEESAADETPEATEGDDEPLVKELAELAAKYRLDPQLLDGCESLDEATRFVNRMYDVFYREGEQTVPMPQQSSTQSDPVKDEIEDLDLDAYDEDDPNRKNFEKLHKLLKDKNKALAELRTERDRERQVQIDYAQRQAALEFQKVLQRKSPELFGTEKAQNARQASMEREAFGLGDYFLRKLHERGLARPDYDALADQVLARGFSDELASKKQTAKREAIAKRLPQRSVGAPARVARSIGQLSDKPWTGPMEENPALLEAVDSVFKRRA